MADIDVHICTKLRKVHNELYCKSLAPLWESIKPRSFPGWYVSSLTHKGDDPLFSLILKLGVDVLVLGCASCKCCVYILSLHHRFLAWAFLPPVCLAGGVGRGCRLCESLSWLLFLALSAPILQQVGRMLLIHFGGKQHFWLGTGAEIIPRTEIQAPRYFLCSPLHPHPSAPRSRGMVWQRLSASNLVSPSLWQRPEDIV